MKRILLFSFFCCVCASARSQYYLRGEVKDENNNSLGNAKILLHSTNYFYNSDTSGVFEILINGPTDSVTISADGYKSVSTQMEAGQYQYIILNLMANAKSSPVKRLSSVLKNRYGGLEPYSKQGEKENLRTLSENYFVPANQFPGAEFSVNPDKISYNNFQRYIHLNSVVPPDALRVEELFNYFNLDYRQPGADSIFSYSSYLTGCPWNQQHQLLLFHVNAKKIDLEKVPRSNLVFLIDATGSMGLPNRLPLLKSAMHFLVGNLREKDTISIVTYGASTNVVLPPTPGDYKGEILDAIEQIHAGGSLPGDMALRNAYTIAESQFIQEGNNKVILVTDGDFNIGQSTQEEMEKLIMTHKRWGIYLSCIGVGMNARDEKLQVLAERGNGSMSYVNDEKTAEKTLMHEFAQIVYSVANNAFFDVQLDSNAVQDYRLIGFENKTDALKDSSSRIVGGEVGSGSSILSMLEITPAPDSIRNLSGVKNIGNMRMHYKLPGDSVDKIFSVPLPSAVSEFTSLPASYRFAASVAWCTSLMKSSLRIPNSSWNDAIGLAVQSQNDKDVFQNDFVALIQKAKKIYAKQRKRK